MGDVTLLPKVDKVDKFSLLPKVEIEKKESIQKPLALTKQDYKKALQNVDATNTLFNKLNNILGEVTKTENPKNVFNSFYDPVLGISVRDFSTAVPTTSQTTESNPFNINEVLFKTSAKVNNISDDELKLINSEDEYKYVKNNPYYTNKRTKLVQDYEKTLNVLKEGDYFETSNLLEEKLKQLEIEKDNRVKNIKLPNIQEQRPTIHSSKHGYKSDIETAYYEIEKSKIETEHSKNKYDLLKAFKESDDVATKVAIMYNDPVGSLKLDNTQFKDALIHVGNQVENLDNTKKRNVFNAYKNINGDNPLNPNAEGPIKSYTKDYYALSGVTAELRATGVKINQIQQSISEDLKELENLQQQLQQNPQDEDLVRDIQTIIDNKINPAKNKIQEYKNYATKLNEFTLTLTNVRKDIENQKKVDADFQKMVEWADKSIFGKDRLYGERFAIGFVENNINSLYKTLAFGGKSLNELGKTVGATTDNTYYLDDINFDKERKELILTPSQTKGQGLKITTNENGKYDFTFDWNILGPQIAKTTGELLLMRGVAKPFQGVSEFAGLYAGSAVVFGGQILEDELNKGLSFKDAMAVTSFRLGVEAVTEKINPLEYMSFGKTTGFLSNLTKKQYLDFVGGNFKALMPKLKSMGIDVLKFIAYTSKQAGFESLEEVASDLGNYGVDLYVAENIKSDYEVDTPTLNSLATTFITTAITMAPTALFGAGSQIKADKNILNLRVSVMENPDLFLNNLEQSFEIGQIDKDYYEKAKGQLKEIKDLTEPHKPVLDFLKDNFEKADYIDLLFKQKELLQNPTEENLAKLEFVLNKLEKYKKDSGYSVPPTQRSEFISDKKFENLQEFATEETIQSASIEDLEIARQILQGVIDNNPEERFKEEAKYQLDIVENKIKELEANSLKDQQDKEQEEILKIKEQIKTNAKNLVNKMSLEELKDYSPFQDESLKSLTNEELEEIVDLKFSRTDELEQESKEVVLTDRNGKDTITFYEGDIIDYQGNSYKVLKDKDGKGYLHNDITGATKYNFDIAEISKKEYNTSTEILEEDAEESTEESTNIVEPTTEQQESLNKINQLIENGKQASLIEKTKDKESHYSFLGKLYKRVSTFVGNALTYNTKDSVTNTVNSVVVGNFFDTFARLYYRNPNLTIEEFKEALKQRKDYEQFKKLSPEAIFNESKKRFREIRDQIKKDLNDENAIFITDDVFVHQDFKKDDWDGVAGTLDMIVITSDGKIHIYDFKSKIESNTKYPVTLDSILTSTYGKQDRAKWARQQSAYAKMLSGLFGEVPDINIIVIPVKYSREEFKGDYKNIEDIDNFKPSPSNLTLPKSRPFIVKLEYKDNNQLSIAKQTIVTEKETSSKEPVAQETSTKTSPVSKPNPKKDRVRPEAIFTNFEGLQTTNWSKALTLPNILEHLVKVVNVNTLKFEDLPLKTQEHFLKINKTNPQDAVNNDSKGKILQIINKDGSPLIVDGKPVLALFPAHYTDKSEYEFNTKHSVSDELFAKDMERIKDARANNLTFKIKRILNYPIQKSKGRKLVSSLIKEGEKFSISQNPTDSKKFILKIGDQVKDLFSRKLKQEEIEAILYLTYKKLSTGGTPNNLNTDKGKKVNFLDFFILTGEKSANVSIKRDFKSKPPKQVVYLKKGGNFLEASEEEFREYLSKAYININKSKIEENKPFVHYKFNGKDVEGTEYKTYTEFLINVLEVEGSLTSQLDDNLFLEIGDIENSIADKMEIAAKGEIVDVPEIKNESKKEDIKVDVSEDIKSKQESLKKLSKKLDTPSKKDDFSGLLRHNKHINKVSKEQEKEAKEWWEKSPLSKYVKLHHLQNIINSNAYATWIEGAITLFNGSKLTDIYHEAWHEFSQMFISKKQKDKLYKELKALNVDILLKDGSTIKSSEASDKDLEEYYAEDFKNYAESGGTLIHNKQFQRNSLFRNIYNFLKELITGTTDLQTIYNRLYTGNISRYDRNVNNAYWGNLNLGLQFENGDQFTDEETKNLYKGIDSLISSILKQNNKQETLLFSDNKVLPIVYSAIYKRFVTEYNDILNDLQNTDTESMSVEDQQKFNKNFDTLNILSKITDNWTTVVNNHVIYSPFFNIAKNKVIFDENGNITSLEDEFNENTDAGNSNQSDLIKNENKFSKETASHETLYKIATLRQYDENHNVVYNPLLPFIPNIVDFNTTWDQLTTSVNNTLNYDQLLDKIKQLGKKNKSFIDLYDSLPKAEGVLTDDEHRMKASFMNDISKPLVPVYEMVLKKEKDNLITTFSPAATTDKSKIKNKWEDNFQNSIYLKEDERGFLFIDRQAIINKYSSQGTTPAFYITEADYKKADKETMYQNRLNFLSEIGINFSENTVTNPDFKEMIINDPFSGSNHFGYVSSIYEAITKKYKSNPVTFKQIDDSGNATKNYLYIGKSINTLVDYEVENSENIFTQSVKNAELNSVWQIRNWNYITKVFNALNDYNKYPTYQDLIKEDWLKQFDFNVNPYVNGIYLNSLFDLDEKSETYGKRRVIKVKGKEVFPTISLIDYNGLRVNEDNNTTNIGKTTTGLTVFEKVIQNISTLLLYNTQENLRYGDKSSSYSTLMSHYYNKDTGQLEKRESIIPFQDFDNNQTVVVLPKKAIRYLLHNLVFEILPMVYYRHENIGLNFEHYTNNIQNFGTFDNILSKETKEQIKQLIIEPNVSDVKEIAKILQSLNLQNDFEKYILNKTEDLKKMVDTGGLLTSTDLFDPRLTTYKKGKDKIVRLSDTHIYVAYIVNSLLYNMEHTKLISFDPRFYKTPKDVIKRLSKFTADGNIFLVDEQTNDFIENKGNLIAEALENKLKTPFVKVPTDGTINSSISEDQEYSAEKLKERYIKYFTEKENMSSEQLKDIYKSLNKITETDGQGHITLDLLRQSKLRAGSSHWTKDHEAAYLKEVDFISGKSDSGMSSEEAVALFTPQKWQYAGIGLWKGLIPYPVFYKFSVVPLIPSAIKGTNFEVIHENLLKNGVGLHLFNSGSKSSSVKDVQYNEDGTIKKNSKGKVLLKANPFYSDYTKRIPFIGDLTINKVFFHYLKEQVNVEPKLKGIVVFATQMRKLLHLNLYTGGVPNDIKMSLSEWSNLSKQDKLNSSGIYRSEQRFGDVIQKLVEIEQAAIIEKMGATLLPDGNYKLNAEKLSNFFKEEFIKRDLPNEILNYLQVKDGEFIFPIDAFKQRATIEKLAEAVANKKLIQQKMNGEALVQVASTGFELTNKFSEVLEDSDLPFYDAPGKAQKIKLAFSKRWSPLLALEYKGEKIKNIDRLNEAIKDKDWLKENRAAITIVGVRIPVQGLNSQEFMEVYHFLPESMGNVIVVSPALVAKSGGDFDIDKLTTFFPNLDKKGKLYTLKTEEELKESYNTLVNKFKTEDKDSDKLISAIFGITEDELQDILIEELVDNKEIVPFEVFKNKLNKKAYENEIISIIRETLSREDNFFQLTRPNDTDLLNNNNYGAELLKKIFARKNKDNTYTSVIDFQSIAEEFTSNLVGKSNLGIAAVANVFFALSQRAGLKHNNEYIKDGKNKLVQYYLPHNTDENGNILLSGLKSKNSENYISDIISQFINGFVDVVKDDWVFFINGVKELVPTMLYTTMAGTNAKTTIAFFNQPIIRAYTGNISKFKNLYTKIKYPELYEQGNWNAFKETIETYVNKEEYLKDLWLTSISKALEKGKIPNPVAAIKNYILNNVNKDFLNEDTLFNAINSGEPLNTEQQLLILFHFWQLKEQSGFITNLQRSLNSDTKKVDSVYGSIERQNLFQDIISSGIFNEDALYRMRDESTIKGFTNGINGFDAFTQKLFNNLFEITNHPLFNNKIRALINSDDKLKFIYKTGSIEKFVNVLKNDFITFIYQNEILEKGEKLANIMAPYFSPKTSIIKELVEIKNEFPELKEEFNILSRLVGDTVKRGNQISQVNLKLKSRLKDSSEINEGVRQIKELLNYANPKYTQEQQIKIREFADKLVKFMIVQSDLNSSIYNLLELVPNENYSSNFKHIIKTVQNRFNNINDHPQLNNIIERFYNMFKTQNHRFYDNQVRKIIKNKNYVTNSLDISGAIKEKRLKIRLEYIPNIPAKVINKKATLTELTNNKNTLYVIYDLKNIDEKIYNSKKLINFATLTSTSNKDVFGQELNAIIDKSMNFENIALDIDKGFFEDLKELDPEMYNYTQEKLNILFRIGDKNIPNLVTNENIKAVKLNEDQQKSFESLQDFMKDPNAPKVETVKQFTRDSVEKDTERVYLFGDNFEDAKTGYVPSSTQAVIRGLPNAIGISTKRDRFTNENLENPEYKIAIKEANSRPSTTNIPQNLVSGIESYGTLQYANNEAIKLLGKNPTSIDMIDAGIRTRTTRTDKELEKYNIKVGSYIKMFGKSSNNTTKNVIVKIIKITKGYDDVTWYKEGWTQEGLQKLKAHTNTANAIEFEVIKPIKSSYLSDSDFDMFKQHVDEQIQKAKDSGKIIVLPEDGIGTGKAMLKEKAPKLFEYLQQELNKLKKQQKSLGFTQETQEITNTKKEQIKEKTEQENKEWNNSIKLQKQNIFTVKPIQAVDRKAVIKASVANKFIGFAEGIEGSSTENYRQQILKQIGKKIPIVGDIVTINFEIDYKDVEVKAKILALEINLDENISNKGFSVDLENIKTGKKYGVYVNTDGTISQFEGKGGLRIGTDNYIKEFDIDSQKEADIVNSGNYSSTDVVFVSIGGKRGNETIRKKQQDKTIIEALKAIEAGATLITDNVNYIHYNSKTKQQRPITLSVQEFEKEDGLYNLGEKRLYENLKDKGYSYSEQTIDGQVLGIWTSQPTKIEQPTVKVEVVSRYSDAEVKANPDKIYVFGDNTQRVGTGGQAQIRNNPNAFGIATKLKPTMNADAFMTDNDLESNKQIIDSDIAKIKTQNKTVVLPKDGFGTGLAKLKEKAPKTYEYLKQRLLQEFGFNNDTGEVVKQSETKDVNQSKFEQADKLTPIEQNFKDGQGGRTMQPQFKGKSTMDLIISGDRTRTTRANTDIQRMAKDYGLSKISDLIGKVIRMTDKLGNQVYTEITGVFPFTQEYQDKTWQKEGWSKDVTDKLVGQYPYAIEFKVVNKETKDTHVTEQENNQILNSKEFQDFAKLELEKNPESPIEEILEYYKKCKK